MISRLASNCPRKMDKNTQVNIGSKTLIQHWTASVQPRQGTLDGLTLRVRQADDDVDEQIQPSHRRQSLGLDAPKTDLLLKQMKMDISDKSSLLTRSDTQQFLRALGQTKSSADLAQDLLHRFLKGAPLPQPGKSSLEIAEFNAALQRLDAALTGTDNEFVEWMSPLTPETPDLSTLAKKLQDAGSDQAKMQSLLGDFKGIPHEDKEKVARKFETLRFDLDALKNALRDAQNLPSLDEQTKRQIREKVQDEIRELQREHGTHLLAFRNLLTKAGNSGSKELAETYDELVHGAASGLAATMESLVTKHPETELLQTVIPILEKTLSHELSLGDEMRSTDKEKLHAILSEIQNMHVLKTIVERLQNFVSSLGRLYGFAIR